jgi:hypothetical protein
MRPIGVTAIAVLTWLRGFLYALGGLALIGVGHLSAKLVSTVANDSFFENLLSRLGKTLCAHSFPFIVSSCFNNWTM